MEKVLLFLQELSVNNNREWFNDHRKEYEESRDKILFITEILTNEIRKFDADIPAINPKDCMFRIFRDVRFSKNKEPYKTNFGSFIARGGRKSTRAGYYFHIDPTGSFAGGGIFMPPAEPLKTIRNHLSEHAEDFLEIINDKSFNTIFPEMHDHQLKTAPKGFPKDHKYIKLLRYKSFAFSTTIKKEEIIKGNFIDNIVLIFKQLHRANYYLNQALDKKN